MSRLKTTQRDKTPEAGDTLILTDWSLCDLLVQAVGCLATVVQVFGTLDKDMRNCQSSWVNDFPPTLMIYLLSHPSHHGRNLRAETLN